MGERVQQNYSSWKAAIRKAYPGVEFRGNKDIGAAFVTVDGKAHDVGEWDGSEGCVFGEKRLELQKQIEEMNQQSLEADAKWRDSPQGRLAYLDNYNR